MSNTNFDPSLNATRHAAAAERLFIHGENPEDFKSLLDDLFAQYQPANTRTASFVADFARARWVFDRRQRVTFLFPSFSFTYKHFLVSAERARAILAPERQFFIRV